MDAARLLALGPVDLAIPHAGLWWGVLLLVIGLAYVRAFRPRRR